MNNKVKLLSIVLITIAIALAGWFAYRKSFSKSDSVAIREIDTTAPSQWELAKKLTGRDILVEEGVKIEPVHSIHSSGGTVVLQALLASNIDVNSSSAWPPFINIIARGGKIKALLGTAVSTRENQTNGGGLLVLNESTIHSIRDLPGKRIAVNVLGAEADYVTRLYLKKNGLSISQVELVVVPMEKQEQMLRSHQVDAIAFATGGGIYFDMAVENGWVREIPGTTNFDTKGEAVAAAIGFRSDFIEQHPEAVRRYIRAYDVSRRIIYDAFQQDPERVKKAYADISIQKGGNPRLSKYFRVNIWTPEHPFITDKDLQWWIDRFIEDGLLKPGQIKPSDIYTNEFNPLYKKK